MHSLVNISIDDVSPHPNASVKVLDRCFELISDFPDIKFTLFVPMAYWRSVSPHNTDKPLIVSNDITFCDKLKSLPEKNFEICFHGLFHGVPQKSNNDEFQSLSYVEAIEKFEMMFEIQGLAGLTMMKKVFRPPAWRMSSASFDAALSVGVNTLALSPKDYAQKTYGGRNKTFERVIYYNVNPPFDPLALFPKTEVVYHACSWDANALSIKATLELKEFLMKNNDKIKFVFIEGLL